MVNGREGNKHTILRAIPIIFYLIFGSILRAIRVCSLSLSFKSSYTQSNEKSEAVQPLKQKPHKLSHILSWSSWIYGLPLISSRRVWKGLKKIFHNFYFLISLPPSIHNCFYYCMIARDSGNFYGTHVLFDFFSSFFAFFYFFFVQWRSFKFQLFFVARCVARKLFSLIHRQKKEKTRKKKDRKYFISVQNFWKGFWWISLGCGLK